MKIITQHSIIYISSEIQSILTEVLKNFGNRKIFILVDENTRKHCLPAINNINLIKDSEIIEIESGEKNKSIKSVEKVWNELTTKGADRNSLLINLGGGIIGDLGGFVASTFKRGIDFINIPTTLLSQVDASIGGKTGINFLGLKNEIGVFNHPKYVIIDSSFNQTLDKKHIMSGWAEMLKHALIFDEKDWNNLISNDIKQTGFKELNQLIARSVSIKNHFVEKDPFEKNIRKALNFGHTLGHAFESFFMNINKKITHGEAVIHGIICELFLSEKICNFSSKKANEIIPYLLKTYTKLKFNDSDINDIIEYTSHDKKNEGLNISFTLLEDFGQLKIDQFCKKDNITEALNCYRKL